MDRKNKGRLGQILQVINIVPLLIFGCISIFLCYYCFTQTMYGEIEQELRYVAHNVQTLLDTVYPGDYQLLGEATYRLYKGDTDITQAYELVDNMKSDSELEITLFYEDTRILTTIRNLTDGTRIVGSGAPDLVVKDVLQGGNSCFYTKVMINGTYYFAYYMPIHNSDGEIKGMIFVGKPSDEVNSAVLKSLYPFIFVTIVAILLICIFLISYTGKIARVLLHIRNFLAEVSTGNLTAELASSVANRGDEFGDIGRSAVSMQSSLRTMIEQDALTGLSNRRAADRRLKQIIRKYETQQTPFSLAIGDIDFFKKVNDTYGHECGDLILKNVADMLREHMKPYGFAARWGGEEFLLVFDHSEVAEAHAVLEGLLEDIREMESIYDGQTIKVTMTFGLTAGNTTDITKLIRTADENLYEGKTKGRNRIIWEEPANTDTEATTETVDTDDIEDIDDTEDIENIEDEDIEE